MMAPTTVAEHRVDARGSIRALAVVAAVLGPAAALLYETGRIDFFRVMPLLNIWVVVLVSLVGVWVGVTAVRRRAFVVGVLCLIGNAAVIGLYGFLAAFFSLGGSR